jgi:acetolactate synthase-1/2/3 large subunit
MLLAEAERPVLDARDRRLGRSRGGGGTATSSRRLQIPTLTNGMGRGIVPGGHPLLVTKARGQALGRADLVIVVGTALDFRLGYGQFGGPEKNDGLPFAKVVHVADSAAQISGHADLAASASGDLSEVFTALLSAVERTARADWSAWTGALQETVAVATSQATANCCPPRPTRSTRHASTANSSRAWPTTRS